MCALCPALAEVCTQRVFLVFNEFLSLRFNGHFPGEPGLAGVY